MVILPLFNNNFWPRLSVAVLNGRDSQMLFWSRFSVGFLVDTLGCHSGRDSRFNMLVEILGYMLVEIIGSSVGFLVEILGYHCYRDLYNIFNTNAN